MEECGEPARRGAAAAAASVAVSFISSYHPPAEVIKLPLKTNPTFGSPRGNLITRYTPVILKGLIGTLLVNRPNGLIEKCQGKLIQEKVYVISTTLFRGTSF